MPEQAIPASGAHKLSCASFAKDIGVYFTSLSLPTQLLNPSYLEPQSNRDEGITADTASLKKMHHNKQLTSLLIVSTESMDHSSIVMANLLTSLVEIEFRVTI